MFKKLLILLLVISQQSYSQCMDPIGNPKVAKNYMAFQQFRCALAEYLKIYEEKPDKVKLNRSIAECYTGIPGSGGKAIKYLEFIKSKGKATENDIYLLSFAHHQAGNYDKAVAVAQEYIKTYNPVEEQLKNITKIISQSKVAKELVKFPISIRFENLGERINSEYEEYYPFCTSDEGMLYFNSTRKPMRDPFASGNGYVTDVYSSKFKGKKYAKPRAVGASFNTIDYDELAGSSADGKYLFVATDSEGFQIFNLKMSSLKPRARSYPRPISLEGINQQTTNEIAATITNDGSTIIFSSDRPGGQGGYDLWLSRKLPNGSWGIPVNLGPEINTADNEVNPQFTEYENSILFASDGDFSMGGYDLFESKISENFKTWGKANNMGYPINSQFDDKSIWRLQKNRLAYKADHRDDSFGLSDIYRLVFLDSIPQYTIFNIDVDVDSTVIEEIEARTLFVDSDKITLDSLLATPIEVPEDSALVQAQIDSLKLLINEQIVLIESLKPNCFAEILVSDAKTEEEYGQYKSNPIKGGVLMILEPGDYDISIIADGFKPLNKSLRVDDKTSFKRFRQKKYLLKRK